jgi:hypothetical protein
LIVDNHNVRDSDVFSVMILVWRSATDPRWMPHNKIPGARKSFQEGYTNARAFGYFENLSAFSSSKVP